MAITIKMHTDVRKKRTKFIGPFTFRQCLCIAIGAAIATPIVKNIPVDVATKLIIGAFIALPVIFCGFIQKDGQFFEVLLVRWVYKMILTPRLRKKKDMAYTKLRRKYRQEKEKEKLAKMSKREQKKYLKTHKNGKKPMNYRTKKASTKMYR